LGAQIGGYCIGMATVVAVVVFIAIAIGAAELVRAQCRRMLRTPVQPRSARPARVRTARAPVAARIAEPATTLAYATASAA